MNQQTSYSLKASILEYKKNSHTLGSKEHVAHTKKFQSMPNIVEIARIMFGAISAENARKMTLQERHAFYEVTNELVSLTYKLS
ncbi:MAG: hypothetical protein KGI10_03885 [Thaumarchaeota archaeon]|nr:hypothetical protein [Nitrososphaerota archaeon]